MLFLAASDMASAQRAGPEQRRVSRPDRCQRNNAPVYSDCGQLNLYKTETGREWRLEDTCDQLIDVMLPTIKPTPTPGPTGGPITPTAPPRATVSGESTNGFFSEVSNTRWTLTNFIPDLDKDHT